MNIIQQIVAGILYGALGGYILFQYLFVGG